jgi:3-dehydroquinate synthase
MNQTTNPPQPAANAKSEGPTHRIDLRTAAGAVCPIVIAPGLRHEVGQWVCRQLSAKRALVVVDTRIAVSHGGDVMKSIRDAGIEVRQVESIAAESKKTLDGAKGLYAAMAEFRLERAEPVIAVGGGVVGDTAGFAAATWHRGVPLVHVPTTLLAMVDASIGGKTAVNFELAGGTLGKNLIGAFHQPVAVLDDPQMLSTLEPRELRCGLAECIKHAMLADAALLEWIDAHLMMVMERDAATLATLIDRCARIKVNIVQEDERESGRRALLNLGHTFAHAIEPIEQLDLKHGEAVSIGLVAAMHMARQTERMTEAEVRTVTQVLHHAGLPVRMKSPIAVATLVEAMGQDKKVQGGRLRLILPRGIGQAEIVTDVKTEVIEAAWRNVGAV